MTKQGKVNLQINRQPLEFSRKSVDGKTHKMSLKAGEALIDDHGLIRIFETHWADGFVGHYVLAIEDDPTGDSIKSVVTMLADFGLGIAGGKLIKIGRIGLGIEASETVDSFINFGFGSKVTAPVVTWIYDKFNPPRFAGYQNMLTGRLIYPGGAIKVL